MGDGLRAFVGTVGVDDGIDTEFGRVAVSDLEARDALVRDLAAQSTQSPPIQLQQQAGAGETAQPVQVVVLELP